MPDIIEPATINKYKNLGCGCGCGQHCGISCQTDDCDCTECTCIDCRDKPSIFNYRQNKK